jgi:hypothetical protein
LRPGDRLDAQAGVLDVLGDVRRDAPTQVGGAGRGAGLVVVRAERHLDERGDLVGHSVPVVDVVRGPDDGLGQGARDDAAQPVLAQRAGRGGARVVGVEIDEVARPRQHQQSPPLREVPGERAVGLVHDEPAGLERSLPAVLLDHRPTLREQPDLQVGVAVAGELRGAHAGLRRRAHLGRREVPEEGAAHLAGERLVGGGLGDVERDEVLAQHVPPALDVPGHARGRAAPGGPGDVRERADAARRCCHGLSPGRIARFGDCRR